MFDWAAFLTSQGIEFVTRGPNTGRDQVGVQCPFCGADDASQHMAISVKGHGWSCRRNQSHRGRSRTKLIQALLRCSPERARQLAEEGTAILVPPAEGLGDRMRELITGSRKPYHTPVPLSLKKGSCKPLSGSPSLLARPFFEYLKGRGYRGDQLEWIIDKYQLHYVTYGLFRYRLVIPVFSSNGQLITWTARTVYEDEPVRYRTLTCPPAIAAPGDFLLGLPLLWGCTNPRVLIICEGPLDAIRVSALGHRDGVYGTCLFGLRMSESQAELIEELSARFDRIGLLLDDDAAFRVLRIWKSISSVSVRSLKLPSTAQDPGELDELGLEFVVNQFFSRREDDNDTTGRLSGRRNARVDR
jgi:hypothetical protein